MAAPANLQPDSGRFDVIPYSDLSDEKTWTRLGRGSFGCVFKGLYLGLEVAIKEVLNSDEYDVDKYFRRECTLMKECRHPNIVQFIGLCLAPSPPPEYLPPMAFDSNGQAKPPLPARRRILIISEFLPNGNLRSHIVNQNLDFSWRLRLSFATDVARAVAYLHARNCLHRDLKGENLLITENDRIKVCDFGFARLAAKNEEEMRRMSYCGTDGYMSPEILMGDEFGLETDIFSLGVIFCEIASRRLVDDTHFKRVMPTFGLDEEEIRSRASPGCPPAFLELAIVCVTPEPAGRPKIRAILEVLREIERDIIESQLAAASGAGYNVGSLTFGAKHAGRKSVASKRPAGPGRIPSFQGQVSGPAYSTDGGESSEDEDVEETIAKLEALKVGNGRGSFYLNAQGAQASSALAADGHSSIGKYSVIKPSKHSTRSSFLVPDAQATESAASSASTVRANNNERESILTTRSAFALPESWVKAHEEKQKELAGKDAEEASQDVDGESNATNAATAADATAVDVQATPEQPLVDEPATIEAEQPAAPVTAVMPGSMPMPASSKFATIKSLSMPIPATPETMPTAPSTGPSPHRFTLIKPGWKALWEGSATAYTPQAGRRASLASGPSSARSSFDGGAASAPRKSTDSANAAGAGAGLAAFLPAQLLGAGLLARCSMCDKRLGLLKPYLACDDCQQIFHVKCGDLLSADCRGLSGHAHVHASAGSTDSAASSVPSKSYASSASGAKDRVAAALKKGKRESKKLVKTSSSGSGSSSVVVVN